jgi:hypothetical protein
MSGAGGLRYLDPRPEARSRDLFPASLVEVKV